MTIELPVADARTRYRTRPSFALRVLVALIGLVALAVGVVFLFHPDVAARFMTLLIGLGFAAVGLLEVAARAEGPRRGSAVMLGAMLVAVGVLAVVFPKATLLTLALIVGLGLIAHGAAQIVVSLVGRHEIPGWGWLVAAGAVNVALGAVALVWPKLTVVLLSVILGVQILLFAYLLLIAAFVPWAMREPGPA
jgi:uncharacterized membrane protein HdeD (DUF308 family)